MRIVTTHMHKSYNAIVQNVTQMYLIRKAGGLKSPKKIDLHERPYSDDHLPEWDPLKDALIQQYDVNSKAWGDSKESSSVPSMIMNNGGGGNKCFACGETGHRRGDEECTKGPRDVHESAPDWVKKQGTKRGGGTKTGGKSGKPQICRYFAQHGSCKFGKECKFTHDKGAKNDATSVFGSKAGHKRAVALVAQSLIDGRRLYDKNATKRQKKGDLEDPVTQLYSMMAKADADKEE